MLVLAVSKPCPARGNLVGHISSCSGDIQVKRAHEKVWTKAALSMPVYFGDTIRTGDQGQGAITYVDNSVLRVHAHSCISLNALLSPVERKNSVLLFFGRIWNRVSRKLSRRKAFEVHTPTAVCGVRGTEFGTASYEDGTMIVRVDSGNVSVDNEIDRATLSSKQGAQLCFATRQIRAEPDFSPDWAQAQRDARENLFADGTSYGGYVHGEIYKRRDHLKGLIEKAKRLSQEQESSLSLAQEAKRSSDARAYELSIAKAKKINEEIEGLNRTIAFYGRRLECHFGLFSRYGYLAKHPVFSKRFRGKEFILQQLDNIEMIHAEFNAMIQEGMKMSMKDMEDLMQEMREGLEEFRRKKGIRDPFDELDRDS
jgi:hypothetical protein